MTATLPTNPETQEPPFPPEAIELHMKRVSDAALIYTGGLDRPVCLLDALELAEAAENLAARCDASYAAALQSRFRPIHDIYLHLINTDAGDVAPATAAAPVYEAPSAESLQDFVKELQLLFAEVGAVYIEELANRSLFTRPQMKTFASAAEDMATQLGPFGAVLSFAGGSRNCCRRASDHGAVRTNCSIRSTMPTRRRCGDARHDGAV